jgi:hypothetical protein
VVGAAAAETLALALVSAAVAAGVGSSVVLQAHLIVLEASLPIHTLAPFQPPLTTRRLQPVRQRQQQQQQQQA